MQTLQAFVLVLAVRGAICGSAGFFCRRLLRRSWLWRAVFCVLIGATVAPACFRFWDDWVVWPASLLLMLVFEGGKNAYFAALYGAPPILLTAAVIFALWSFIIHRRGSDELHMA